jgi:hypothetical protein
MAESFPSNEDSFADTYIRLTEGPNFFTGIPTTSSSLQSNITVTGTDMSTSVFNAYNVGSILSSESASISQLRNQIASIEMELSILKAKSIEIEMHSNMWRETAEDLASEISDIMLSAHGREASESVEKMANRARIRNEYEKRKTKATSRPATRDNTVQECTVSETGIGAREIQFDKTQ